METIKRISEFFGKSYRAPELKKKSSSFKPATRLEMIRQRNYVYPASTESKFILAANLDGSGFQRSSFPLCPKDVPLEQMVQQINRVCYRQWERSRNYYTLHPFECLDRFSNVSFVLAAALSVILLTMIVYGDANSLNNALFVFACFRTHPLTQLPPRWSPAWSPTSPRPPATTPTATWWAPSASKSQSSTGRKCAAAVLVSSGLRTRSASGSRSASSRPSPRRPALRSAKWRSGRDPVSLYYSHN